MRITKRTFLTRSLTCFIIAAGSLHVGLASKAESISSEEAHAIAVDAYLYFYPFVTMDITRKQLTNVEHAEGISAPMNTFANFPAYPTADVKAVVRPNFDTLYSSGWLRHALFQRLARSHKRTRGRLRAGHRRALLSVPDARYVDRRVHVVRLAHDRDTGRQLSCHAGRLDRLGAQQRPADQGTNSLRMDHWPY